MKRRARRRPVRRMTTVGAVLALVVVAAFVLSSPRHRGFYLGMRSGAWPPPPSPSNPALAAQAGRSAAPATTPAPRSTFGLPLGLGRARAAPVAPLATSTVARARVRVPRPDGRGQIRVPIADEVPQKLPALGLPAGWELREFDGRAETELVNDEGRLALRLASEGSSFAIHRDVVLDLKQFPVLTWSWKAVRLPAGGDGRDRATDDQVAQVYVIIPRWPFPRANSDVIGYVWDTRAPMGERITSPRAPNVRSIVVESGYERLGIWVREERDVYEDYRTLFGREPTRVGKLAVMTDSNDTATRGEALIGDLIFFRPPAGNARIFDGYATMPRS